MAPRMSNGFKHLLPIHFAIQHMGESIIFHLRGLVETIDGRRAKIDLPPSEIYTTPEKLIRGGYNRR